MSHNLQSQHHHVEHHHVEHRCARWDGRDRHGWSLWRNWWLAWSALASHRFQIQTLWWHCHIGTLEMGRGCEQCPSAVGLVGPYSHPRRSWEDSELNQIKDAAGQEDQPVQAQCSDPARCCLQVHPHMRPHEDAWHATKKALRPSVAVALKNRNIIPHNMEANGCEMMTQNTHNAFLLPNPKAMSFNTHSKWFLQNDRSCVMSV